MDSPVQRVASRVRRHGRADPGPPPQGRGRAQRHAQCGGDLRNARFRHRGREHLRRHYQDGHGSANSQGSIHSDGGSLCVASFASDASCIWSCLGSFIPFGSCRACRGDTLSSDPRGARGIYRRRRPGLSPQPLDRAVARSSSRTHTVMFDKTGTLTVGGARLRCRDRSRPGSG
jgi:hypothetical protein